MTDSPDTTVTPDTARASGLRGLRYGEVILVRAHGDRLLASVYNTFPLNDCPAELWDALDTAVIAGEHDSLVAILNGPRHWLMDFIGVDYTDPGEIHVFGGLQMFQRATIDITERGLSGGPYSPVHVDRKALFGFDAGSTVYELIGPDGARYVMQAWSRQVDPTLDETGLVGLADRLALPEGWAYRSRVLETELLVDTRERLATVLQDELQNSYSLIGA